MKRLKQSIGASTAWLAIMVATTTAARAQQTPTAPAPPASAASDQPAGIPDIVVTAEKRSQSAERVGMAITAVNGDDLKLQGVRDVTDLVKIDPSFTLSQSNFGGVIYQIRGVGYNDYSLAASPTVSVYTDEVPYAYPDMSKGATFDLERVEILKGPQGTLYGQNATGGAINYIANKPTSTLTAGLEATAARFGAFNANGYISGPLSDTLTARVAFVTDQGGSWQRSYTRDAVLGKKDDGFGRLLLNWKPTDKLTVDVNVNGWIDKSDTQAGQLEGVFFASPGNASHVPGETGAPIAPPDPRAADWYAGVRPQADEHFYQASLHASYALSDRLTLTYLGSYQHYQQNDVLDVNGENVEEYLRQSGSVGSTSQEVRLSGDLFERKLHWLTGLYYENSITDEDQLQDIVGSSSAYSLISLNQGVPLHYVENVSRDKSVAKAAFANVDYALSDLIELHGGLRYTDTDTTHGGCTKDAGDGATASSFTARESSLLHGVGVVPIAPGGCITLDSLNAANFYHPLYVNQTLDQDNVSWNIGIDLKPSPHTLIYGTIRKGYKAGNFPTLTATFSSQLLPVTQEELLAYEIGTKTQLFDNLLQLDADVFYYDYRNKQLAAKRLDGVFGLLNALVNIPRSREVGVEVVARARPTKELTLTAHGTYTDTRVTDTFLNYNPFSPIPIDLQGESFPNVPKWSFAGGFQYNRDVSTRFSAFFGADARWQSSSQGQFGSYQALAAGYTVTPSALQVTNPAVQPGSLSTLIKAYGVLDLRAGLLSRDGTWKLEIFGRNVTNTYYWNEARQHGDPIIRFAGMPATYGITIGYRFGR